MLSEAKHLAPHGKCDSALSPNTAQISQPASGDLPSAIGHRPHA
jgi:hypothetical protein